MLWNVCERNLNQGNGKRWGSHVHS
jgi:hypothetical protein